MASLRGEGIPLSTTEIFLLLRGRGCTCRAAQRIQKEEKESNSSAREFVEEASPRSCLVCEAGERYIVPPLNIFGLGRVRVPILFGNYFPRSDLPYTKGFMKFGCPEPSKKVFDFWNFCSSKRRLTRFVRVPPYEIWVFPTNFIFFQGNEITLRGKKCTALFQTHNW